MKIAIVGYGKMGRLIEQLAGEYGAAVELKLDEYNNARSEGLTAENFKGIDAAIEFSTPEAAPANILKLAELGVPMVVGTTGWTAHLNEVRDAIEKHRTGMVYSPNFSIGVNVFFRVAAETARLLAQHEQYGAWAWEIHHRMKKDAPSGTLLQLVKSMQEAGYSRPIDVASNRAGMLPGTHEIGFDSNADTITLRHTARSREGFARGALTAAQWIVGKKGVYEFSEVLFAPPR